MAPVASAPDVAELDRQVRRGSLFTLAVLHRSAQRLGRAEALLGGVLDVLHAKGLVTEEDLDAALAADDLDEDEDLDQDAEPDEPPVSPVVGWPSVALRTDADPALEPESATEPVVDCATRLPVCQAVCCRLRFMLNAEEVDAGAVRWDIGHPYLIRHDERGTCVHNQSDGHGCSVYDDRPRVCRRYDCTHDVRIWTDFDGMVLNHEWIAANLGPRDITVAAVVPAMLPTPVTFTPRRPSS
ncbi:MAG TPA: hypothetical protein VF244_05450 [Acidimicrobiales bacterium]